ncbi:hypothetical protein GOP47_0027925 [Adiantum capillus-veneris]|nr:hypothetical protein GOP47_0027925 [Adiantum capillus-veneris]
MAAQLRASSPCLHSHASLLPLLLSTRTQRFSVNKGSICPSVSVFRSAGKHGYFTSAYSSFLSPTSTTSTDSKEFAELSEFGGGGNESGNGTGGDGGGGWHDGHAENEDYGGSTGKGGFFAALLKGWNERVNADPQFPFKVLMEQIVGVGASVAGDMASRPNFGLNELDFVFSTLVVGSILNFALMYMLAPTSVAASTASMLPLIFSSCPPGHMFEQGAYSIVDRLGTFVYKGAVFATVGFGAGLFGTFLSNCLIGLRKKMDPKFESQNKAPPTLLNAATWAIHMGVSSNLRYQLINGMEFAVANVLPPPAFKASVFCIRAFNNVLGGYSFVSLARLTGSQKKAVATNVPALVGSEGEVHANSSEVPANRGKASTEEDEFAAGSNQTFETSKPAASIAQGDDDARS